jgi:RimJ/RimL family protein N-acetyltransferase
MKPEAHVPIRLREYHRPALEAHFLALGAEDRRLRFGANLPDESVRAYVARIDFEHDGAFGVQDDALALVAAVHVANAGTGAELGLSVAPGYRGQGLGQSLVRRAVTHLRNRGARAAYTHCLVENGAMMHIARKCGMRVAHSGAESDAHLVLSPPTAGTLFTEWLADRQAETLQAFRHQANATRTLLAPR